MATHGYPSLPYLKRNTQPIRVQDPSTGRMWTFVATRVVTLTLVSEAPRHPTQDGYDVTDSLRNLPVEIEADLVLGGWWGGLAYGRERMYEWEILKNLREQKEPFKLMCTAGYFDRVVVTELRPKESVESINTFECTVRFQQIITSTIKTTVVQWYRDTDGNIIGATPYGQAGAFDLNLTLTGSDEPEPTPPKKSWLEIIWDMIAGGKDDFSGE